MSAYTFKQPHVWREYTGLVQGLIAALGGMLPEADEGPAAKLRRLWVRPKQSFQSVGVDWPLSKGGHGPGFLGQA